MKSSRRKFLFQGVASLAGLVLRPVSAFAFPGITAFWRKKPSGIYASGTNASGVLGIGSTVNKSSPVQIGSMMMARSVATALNHTLAINGDGTLWAWGLNASGQIGDGTNVTKSSPVQIGALTSWNKIAASCSTGTTAASSFAIMNDSTLWSWGYNNNGQLGLGNFTARSSPVQVGTGSWAQVAAGPTNTYGIMTDGSLWSWGLFQAGLGILFNIPRQVGSGTWTSVSAASYYTVAVKSDGTLWGWGSNSTGQLGDGTTSVKSSPVQIGALTNWAKVSATTLSSTDSFTFALKTDGTLWTWGNNAQAQLGTGTTVDRSSPVQVGSATWLDVQTAGDGPTGNVYRFGVGIQSDGSLWTWGTNYYGEIAQTALVPRQIGAATNWAKISTSGYLSMGIKTDGTLWGWGYSGEAVGIGTTAAVTSPIQVGSATTWSQVCAAGGTTLALKIDGTLWASGYNSNGQYGDGTTNDVSTISQIGSTTWSAVSGNGNVGAGIKTDGTIWSWGSNTFYQLGDGTNVSKSSPVQVGAATTWAKLSAGGESTLAIKADGTLWGWGYNISGEIGVGGIMQSLPVQVGALTNWSKVSVGNDHTVALKTNGTLWAWGSNAYGQVGDGTTSNRSSPVQIGALTTWIGVAAGGGSCVALKNDGTVWAWGANNWGQVGDGTTTNRSSPVQVSSFTSVSSLGDFGEAGTSAAIKSDGTLWMWGSPGWNVIYDLCGAGPLQVGSATNWANIAVGSNHVIARKTDGTLWSWGSGGPQVGFSTTANQGVVPVPTQIGALTTWASVGAGADISYGVKSDGTLWGWGLNTAGNSIGDGTATARSSPVQIGLLTNWSKVQSGRGTSGGAHTLALKTDGTLWAWGGNASGQLGDGTAANKNSPVQIGSATDWNILSAGQYTAAGYGHSMAIKTDGTLWAWGGNAQYQLGFSPNAPMKIDAGATPWVRVAAGLNYGVAIKNDGTLWAWGINNGGVLGDGTTVAKSSPVQIGLLTNWSKIFAGAGQTFGIQNDGSLWCWGYNTNGQLGLGSTTSYSSPVQVGALTWSEISVCPSATGYSAQANILGVQTDNTLWGWGQNAAGQLGQGNVAAKSSPVQVGTLAVWTKVAAGISYAMMLRF